MPKEINHESHTLVKKIYGGMIERKKNLLIMVFIALENPYNRLSREILEKALKKKGKSTLNC